MTSYRLSELPTPYRSTGASPLGAHEGTVTPPDPPTPPTPTAKTYFSGASVDVNRQDAWYMFIFDPADGSNASDLAAKQVGDELSVTVNGTTQTLAVTSREGDSWNVDLYLGENAPTVPLVVLNVYNEDDAHQIWMFETIGYVSASDIPGGVTMTVAEIA